MKRLSKNQRLAAQLIAEDSLTDERIADKCGITARQLYRWKAQDAFREAVQLVSDAYADRALNHGLARKEKRLMELDDIYGRLRTVISARSESPDYQDIPGGTTGIVTKTLKGIGKGEDFQVVEVYEVDNATLKEMRAIHQQYAEELGQRIEKHDVTVNDKRDVDAAIDQLINLGANRAKAQGWPN